MRAGRSRRTRGLAVVLLLLASPVFGIAEEGSSHAIEETRAELSRVLSGYGRLAEAQREAIFGDGRELEEAVRALRRAGPAELEQVRRIVELLPGWEALPDVLGSAAASSLEDSFGTPYSTPYAEQLSASRTRFARALHPALLAYVAQLRALAAESGNPRLVAQADELRAVVGMLGDDGVLRIGGAIAEARAGDGTLRFEQGVEFSECESRTVWWDRAWCGIQALGSTLGTFFTETLPGFGVAAWNAIVGGLVFLWEQALENAGIPAWNAVAGFFGADVPNWWQRHFGNANAGPQCPATGLDVLDLGEMGTIEGYYACKRSVEWLTKIPFELMPSQDVTLVPKILTGAVHFPFRFLCGCYERDVFVRFWDGQREMASSKTPLLDAKLSTVASGATLSSAFSELSAARQNVDLLTAKSVALKERVERLGTDQDDLAGQLLEIVEDGLERRIEADLRRETGHVASLLLPRSLGGALEQVREFVDDRVRDVERRGLDVFHAKVALREGDRAFESRQYVRAFAAYRAAFLELLDLLGG